MYKIKKNKLNLYERNQFIQEVVEECLDRPKRHVAMDMKGVALASVFAKYYLDIDLPKLDDDERAFKLYDLISDIDIDKYVYDDMGDRICKTQFLEMCNAIDEILYEQKEQFDIAKRPTLENLMASIIVFVENLDTTLNGIDGKEMIEMLSNLNENLDASKIKPILDLFGGIGKDKQEEPDKLNKIKDLSNEAN